MASASKSASKRASAAKRTSESKGEAKHTESATATAEEATAEEATAATTGSTALGTADRVTRPGNAETHDEHPKDATASEVAHAPASGTQRAEGGHPAGEYDITNPAKDADGNPTQLPQPLTTESLPSAGSDQTEALLAAHYALTNSDRDQLLKQAQATSRLSDDDRQAALEASPVGFVLEHTGTNAWRCHVTGTQRFGHGATATEAMEAFVIGNQGSAIEVAARQFAQLSPAQQQEIRERDRIAAEGTSGSGADPVESAREAAIKAAQADKTAKRPAVNAASDGAERESARRAKGK